jgi:regulator of protease activity HflC (stomatin/prohibitin superfamily)
VRPWERGIYIVLGRWSWEVAPGTYPIVPWFTEVREFSVVATIIPTPRQDITLRDGRTLTFSAAASARVVDARKALLDVDSFAETTQEAVGAVLAEKIADVAAERLEPQGRRRLIGDLTRWVNEETIVYGVEVTLVRFTTFVLNPKTFRLLQESGPVAGW